MTRSRPGYDRIVPFCWALHHEPRKDESMKTIIRSVLGAGALAMVGAGAALAQGAQPVQPPASQQSVPIAQPVSIVDITELPETTQARVNEVVNARGKEELQKLQAQVEAAPDIRSALQAKGLSGKQVILAQVGEGGQLTLVTRRAG
jgi:ABC-type glycerol-3-phosphate transport system substrate-binding protein